MIRIEKATIKDIDVLIAIGKTTFMEAHASSDSESELGAYLEKSYHPKKLLEEFNDPNSIFHIAYYNKEVAGFSKIIIDPNEPFITKLERIYIYKEFYGKKIGLEILNFNIKLSKEYGQKGMWLYVWVENHRAIDFYKKMQFEIIDRYDFKLSETKSNPNHKMLKKF